jgi:hypothetical protein
VLGASDDQVPFGVLLLRSLDLPPDSGARIFCEGEWTDEEIYGLVRNFDGSHERALEWAGKITEGDIKESVDYIESKYTDEWKRQWSKRGRGGKDRGQETGKSGGRRRQGLGEGEKKREGR